MVSWSVSKLQPTYPTIEIYYWLAAFQFGEIYTKMVHYLSMQSIILTDLQLPFHCNWREDHTTKLDSWNNLEDSTHWFGVQNVLT